MSRGYQKFELDREAVRQLMVESKNLEEFKRFQSIYLRVNEGLTVKQISRIVGLAESSIHNLHNRCRQKGLDALKTIGRGGRKRSYLSLEEEKAVLEKICPEATEGGVLEVGIVHRAFEKKVGHPVARFTIYRLLERHDWRKISPRPRHPKADIEAQDAFKKNGQGLLKKQKNKPKK